MKLFSKITFLCNLSFLAMALLRYIEISNKKNNSDDSILPLPFLTGTLVILGQLAIFISLLYCITVLATWLVKRAVYAPRWLVVVNFLFLLVQVYYFLLT